MAGKKSTADNSSTTYIEALLELILTDNKKARDWFRLMRADGRKEIPKEKDLVNLLGWNAYLTAEQAARGLELFYWRIYGKKDLPDIKMQYSDLTVTCKKELYV